MAEHTREAAAPASAGAAVSAARPSRPLRIAMIGQKGLPATFGGVEHVVEHLGSRLAAEGHRVTVYCREGYSPEHPRYYKGMRLITTPTIASKHLDAIMHSVTSTVHALATGTDIINYHAIGPSMVAPIARYLSRVSVVSTIHGLDHERGKWGGAAQRVLSLGYQISGRVPHRVVTVSRALAERYQQDFACSPVYIPNGVEPGTLVPLTKRLEEEFGLEAGRFVLFVGRLVPEKRPEMLLEAAAQLPAGIKVALVGGSTFSDDYVERLRALADGDPRIELLGFCYGADLASLYSNAAVFVQPSDVEGLPLTLLEALSYGATVVASDIPPHVEVIGSAVEGTHRLFRHGDREALVQALRAVIDAGEQGRSAAREEASRLLKPYDWAASTAQLLGVYRSVGRATLPRAFRGKTGRAPQPETSRELPS